MGSEPGEVGRAPDGTVSPTSSEGGKLGGITTGESSSRLWGQDSCLSGRSIPALFSHTRERPVEAEGFRSTVVSFIPYSGGPRDSSSGPPCDDPCSTGLVRTLADSPFTKKASCQLAIACIFYIKKIWTFCFSLKTSDSLAAFSFHFHKSLKMESLLQ